mmetsp:Transcript_12533/g.24440  ORF Transcript_12533/g.24440 Transcript_12533/m.24440 type:complete len:213 (+) Transcript_12533:166-804(+)
MLCNKTYKNLSRVLQQGSSNHPSLLFFVFFVRVLTLQSGIQNNISHCGLPSINAQFHLLICQKAAVKYLLNCIMLQILADENQVLSAITERLHEIATHFSQFRFCSLPGFGFKHHPWPIELYCDHTASMTQHATQVMPVRQPQETLTTEELSKFLHSQPLLCLRLFLLLLDCQLFLSLLFLPHFSFAQFLIVVDRFIFLFVVAVFAVMYKVL